MGVISGDGGAVNGENTVEAWEIDDQSQPDEVVASNTQNGVMQGCGVLDWTGWCLVKNPTSARFPNDEFTFTGSIDGTNGVTGTAMCEYLKVVCDGENGRYITSLMGFGANGDLTYGAAAASDSTTPNPYCSRGMGVDFNGGALGDVRYWEFTVQARTKQYVSSDTDGKRRRKAGPISGEALIRVFYSAPASLPDVDGAYTVKFHVTDSTGWTWNYLKVTSVKQLWDERRREPVSAEIRGVFTASNGTSVGSILNPSDGQEWPAA